MRKIVSTNDAPGAVGPYSQGIEAAGLVFCSGQIPLDPASDALVEGTIGDQTRRCLDNLAAVLRAAGCSFGDVVKVTAFLTDMNDYGEFNDAYAAYIGDAAPARAAIGVASLPKGARIEVECIALKP